MPRSKKLRGYLIAIEESRNKKEARILEARITPKQKRLLLSIMREFGIKFHESKEPIEDSKKDVSKLPIETILSMPEAEFNNLNFGGE